MHDVIYFCRDAHKCSVFVLRCTGFLLSSFIMQMIHGSKIKTVHISLSYAHRTRSYSFLFVLMRLVIQDMSYAYKNIFYFLFDAIANYCKPCNVHATLNTVLRSYLFCNIYHMVIISRLVN